MSVCAHGRVCLGLGLVRVATASGLFAPVSSSTAFSAATPGGPAFSMTKCGLPALSPGRVRSHTALLSAQGGPRGWGLGSRGRGGPRSLALGLQSWGWRGPWGGPGPHVRCPLLRLVVEPWWRRGGAGRARSWPRAGSWVGCVCLLLGPGPLKGRTLPGLTQSWVGGPEGLLCPAGRTRPGGSGRGARPRASCLCSPAV